MKSVIPSFKKKWRLITVKLSFHHSRLDQGLNEYYSCPTCRKPLFVGRQENDVNPRAGETFSDEQLARQISAGLNRQNATIPTLPTGIFPNQTQNPVEGSPWRSIPNLQILFSISKHE